MQTWDWMLSLGLLGLLQFPFSCFSSISFVQISISENWSRCLNLPLPSWFEGSLASNCFGHVAGCCSSVCHGRGFHQGCFSWQETKWSDITAFNSVTAQTCFALTRVLTNNLSDSGRANFSIYNRHLPVMLERKGRLVYSRGLPNNAISVPR